MTCEIPHHVRLDFILSAVFFQPNRGKLWNLCFEKYKHQWFWYLVAFSYCCYLVEFQQVFLVSCIQALLTSAMFGLYEGINSEPWDFLNVLCEFVASVQYHGCKDHRIFWEKNVLVFASNLNSFLLFSLICFKHTELSFSSQ